MQQCRQRGITDIVHLRGIQELDRVDMSGFKQEGITDTTFAYYLSGIHTQNLSCCN